MPITKKIEHLISIILHGETKPVIANISFLTPSQRLAGKKILITGGGTGLGLGMAQKFTNEGADVLISGRRESILQTSAEKIGCKYLQLDLKNINTFDSFLAKVEELLGGLDCLINNAGISLHEPNFLSVSPDQFDAQIDTNLKGAFFLSQAFVKRASSSIEKTIKNILFVSSETGFTVDERPYGLTKAALNSFVQGLAYRYISQGFRINAIAPGVTISDMVGKNDIDDLAYHSNITGRYYLPEEVAEIACFLLCDASNCINGQVLLCNEGKTINARWK